MKKIGFLVGSLSGAGAEKTILTLSSSMAKLNCNVHLFVLKQKVDYQQSENVEVHFLRKGNKAQQLIFLSKIVAEIKLDLFVTSRPEFYNPFFAKNVYCSVHITPTAWLKKRPLFLVWKTWLQKYKLQKKYKAKKLIALSNGVKKDLVDNLQCRENDIQVINNPFDFKKIQCLGSEKGRLPEGNYIIYVAALIARKRHSDLIRAFSQMKDKGKKLVLVGKGALEDVLKHQVNALGLKDRVVFWGWDLNPYRLIDNASISVLCSEAEGMPRVLIESIVLNTLVVSTNCPSGPNEVLLGENKKYLVPVGDIEKLTKALNLANSAQSPQKIDISRFDSELIAHSYLRLIK